MLNINNTKYEEGSIEKEDVNKEVPEEGYLEETNNEKKTKLSRFHLGPR